jgi:hypothetical protein
MSDRADDVVKTFVYKGAEGTFIITKEQIFQATSKESGGGVTHIAGYSEYRLTSYDAATGKQVARVELGEGIEEECLLIGATPGKIWLYSVDPELGLHCRDPKTLAVISNESALTAAAPLKGFAFARPEWMKLNQFYGLHVNGKLMLTDMQGYHYFYDAEKATLAKTEEEVPDYDWATSALSTSGYFSEDEYISFQNDVRSKLLFRNEDSTGKFSYISGELIMDNDPLHDLARKQAMLDSFDREEARWTDSMKVSSQREIELSVPRSSDFNWDLRNAQNKSEDIKRRLDDIKRDRQRLVESKSRVLDRAMLADEPGGFFVVHATDVTDTAKAVITKLRWKNNRFEEIWSSRLPGFYRDAGKADSKGAFETVFSDGNPEFDYEWFMIAQLQMICLDVKTGKVLWEQPL